MKQLLTKATLSFLALATPNAWGYQPTDNDGEDDADVVVVVAQGSYTVPVDSGDRQAAAFPTTYRLTFSEDGELLEIEYDLPEFLAPASQRAVALSDPNWTLLGFREYSGANGLASCSWNNARLACLVRYPSIGFDADSYLDLLRETFPPAEVEWRAPVVRAFAGEPEGIVEIARDAIPFDQQQ